MVACAGMLLSGSADFLSLGVGAILVVLVAMTGSLELPPSEGGHRRVLAVLEYLKRT